MAVYRKEPRYRKGITRLAASQHVPTLSHMWCMGATQSVTHCPRVRSPGTRQRQQRSKLRYQVTFSARTRLSYATPSSTTAILKIRTTTDSLMGDKFLHVVMPKATAYGLLPLV
jgi:hypothetical protein